MAVPGQSVYAAGVLVRVTEKYNAGSRETMKLQSGHSIPLPVLSNLDSNVIVMERPTIITLSPLTGGFLCCLSRPFAKVTKASRTHSVT